MSVFIDPDDHIPHPLWKVTLTFPKSMSGQEAEEVSAVLEDIAVSVFISNKEATDGDDWTVELTTYGEPDVEDIRQRLTDYAVADIAAERLPEKNWLQHVHDNFPPVTVGRFFVYGSHYTGDKPAGQVPLQIDAATAFGSGEHETTKGCMLALEKLASQKTFKNGLDMGCGSGILAIVMRKLWPEMTVTGIDIDPESVIVSRRHATLNAIDRGLYFEAGDGYLAPRVATAGPYDLIVANILAGPLIDMAGDLANHLTPGGYAVLSGLLSRQKDDVVGAHLEQGLVFSGAEELGDWNALVFEKKTRIIGSKLN